jgi:hypothetical protein
MYCMSQTTETIYYPSADGHRQETSSQEEKNSTYSLKTVYVWQLDA